MDDKSKSLPPGWVVRKSKKYPDRVYYFNINSGLSSWECPDILESIISKNAGNTSNLVPPGTPAVVQSTPKPMAKPETSNVSKAETQSKRNMFNPAHNHTFHGSSAPRGTPNLTKSKRLTTESLEKNRRNVCDKSSTSLPYSSDVFRKKLKKSPSKQSCDKSSVLQTKSHTSSSIHDKTMKKSDNVSKKEMTGLKNGCVSFKFQKNEKISGSASSLAGSHLKSVSTVPKQTHISHENITKVDKSLTDKLLYGKHAVNVEFKHESLPVKMKHSTTTANVLKKVHQSNVTPVVGKQAIPTKVSNIKPHLELKKLDMTNGLKVAGKRKAEADNELESGSKRRTTSTLNTSLVKSINSFESVSSPKSTVLGTKLGNRLKPVGLLPQTKSSGPSPSKTGQKNARNTPKPKGSKLVLPTKDTNDSNINMKVPSVKVSEKEKIVMDKTEETITDLRKVVRAMQQSLKSNRDVSLKDSKIQNVQHTAGNKSVSRPDASNVNYPGYNDLSVRTQIVLDPPVREVAAPAEPVIVIDGDGDDPCKNTEFKVFIGDKNKLLNIQSWINSIQDGSASSSPAQEDLITSSNIRNQSIDSGYTSPPAERGWPGQLKKSDITSRDIVAMEIDECLVPAPGDDEHEDLGEVEDMDIDVVLVEVRNQVRNDDKRNLSSPIGLSEPSDDVRTTTDGISNTVLVVLDTNVIMQNLNLLKNMKSYTLKGNIKATLYIPWIVLCELDRLKISKYRPDVMQLAQKGISFLKDLFVKKFPRVIGQTPKQSDDAAVAFQSACNDDMILQACLQCQQKYDPVILFTNDNNLTVKSLVLGIPASNDKGIYEELRKAAESLRKTVSKSNPLEIDTQTGSIPNQTFTHSPTFTQPNAPVTGAQTGPVHGLVQNQSFIPIQTLGQSHDVIIHSPTGAVPISPCMLTVPCEPNIKDSKQFNESKDRSSSDRETFPVHKPVPKPSLANRILQEERSYNEDMLIDDISCKFKDLLKESLADVLKKEMQSIYGELWLQIVYKKPPWSLKDILISLQKHWRAVFGMVLGRHNLEYIEHLIKSTAKVKENRMCDLLDMIRDGCVILEQAKNKTEYGPRVLEVYNTVSGMKKLCVMVQKQEVNVSSIQSLDQYLHTKLVPNSPINQTQLTSSNTSSCVTLPAKHSKTSVINSNNSTNVTSSQDSICEMNLQSFKTDDLTIHSVSNPTIQTAPGVLQSMTSTGTLQCVQQPGTSQTNSQGEACNSEYQEMTAGERFSTIWKFMYQYCDQFHKAILVNDPTPAVKKEVEPMLQMLVSTALELRKYYVGLLELPVEGLKDHEKEFVSFSNICNNFFTHLNVQDEVPGGKVSPLHLLVLYSKPEYRATLTRFHEQLDEMLNMMYQCLHKLCPDD